MEKETTLPSSSSHQAKTAKKIWWIIAIVMFFLALVCCLLAIVGFFIIRPIWEEKISVPESQTLPSLATSTPIPSLPILPTVDTSGRLDYEANPLYGQVSLQRGFSPDPHVINVGVGGDHDTSELGRNCGFTTSAPTFAFDLSGGASEGFLRIFFIPDDNIDATLIVHTPTQEWICEDNPTYEMGIPVIDIEYAASGEYTIWVGVYQSDIYVPGTLFITESRDTTP